MSGYGRIDITLGTINELIQSGKEKKKKDIILVQGLSGWHELIEKQIFSHLVQHDSAIQ